jgi:YidC/Oxa1 family membrane protein insertase
MYHYLDAKDENPVFGLGENTWTLVSKSLPADDVQQVVFSTTVPEFPKIKLVKTYRLAPKDYHVTLLLEIHDTRGADDPNVKKIPFRYQLTGAQGLPVEGEWYTATFRNALIGIADRGNGLWRKIEESIRISMRAGGDRFPDGELDDSRLQYAGVVNQYFGAILAVDNEQPGNDDGGTTPGNILAWARPTLESSEKKGTIIGIMGDQIVFTDADRQTTTYTLLPRTKRQLADLGLDRGDRAVLSYYELPGGKEKIATWVRLGETLKPQFDDITVRVMSKVIDLNPREVVKHQFVLYHGPVKAALLAQFKGDEAVDSELVSRYTETLHLRTLTDYHSDNWFGRVSSWIGLTWLIIKFTTLMHWLLYLFHTLLGWIPGAYGLSIIVLTVMVRGAMFPISRKQALFSIKMQELAPELKKITDKYPDDPAARWQATQEFNRKHGINPLGSCWPVLLQMPIFLGLYFALQESIHFRLAPFLWIESLSAPDMLLWWSEHIPVISSPDHAGGILGALYLGPYLNVLPMIAVSFMVIQQMQTMPPPTDDQQAMQQKMMKFMSIFFGIMFYKVAAGLCIYFIASSLWGMAERKLLPKKKSAAEYPASAALPGGGSLGGGKPAPKGPAPIDKGKWAKKSKDKAKDTEPVTTFDKLKALWKEILKQAEKK